MVAKGVFSLEYIMKTFLYRLVLLVACVGTAPAASAAKLGYDPSADPFEQYHAAIERAEREDKLVLIIAGGDWCRWCHVLERFLASDPQLEERLNETFVVMKVYVGFDNYNDFFFSQLPPAKGAPHFWIVSPQKEILASQSTGMLEANKQGYDREAFLAFIDEWAAKVRSGATRRVAAL